MSIGRQDIMQVMEKRRSAAPSGGLSDTAILWLIIGGWMAIVAVLSSISEIQALIAR